MQRLCLSFAIMLLLSGLSSASAQDANEAPAPEATADPAWRVVDPENLVLIETKHGVTAIELTPEFAPNHTARMRALVRAGVYDKEYFYRVIDGFVAQAGLQFDERMVGWEPLKNENDRAYGEAAFTPLGNADLFASEVGHNQDGFAMARDTELDREWLLHCPGTLAMARNADPDTGATEFYIVLGAQRYLDRNLTVFGRVIDGMQYIQKLERGDRAVAGGVIQSPRTGDQMMSVQMASDLPEDQQPVYLVQRPGTNLFEDSKQARRVRREAFFYRKPPEVLDICGFDVPVRKEK